MDLVDRCVEDLKRHEGFSSFLYRDTAGRWTIGFGRCLDTRGITVQEAAIWLRSDVLEAVEAVGRFDFFDGLTEARKAVFVNMAFQLGMGGLLKFEKMIAAVSRGDYETAANEMLSSKWAKQAPNRAAELSQWMRNG